MDEKTKRLLAKYAERYETAAFLQGDPSWFMHQVEGDGNREATAFVAAALSFGSRSQFMPRIQWIVERAEGNVDRWIRSGAFERDIPSDCGDCFYRFYTASAMNAFLRSFRSVMKDAGSLGEFLKPTASGGGIAAVKAICARFASADKTQVVPKDAKSACKRICMFLRWMARDGSPVDLGLWSDFLDRRTLIVPLDTHVAQEARRLGLAECRNASMSAALKITSALAEAFPDDPLKGDFALFGYGVDSANATRPATTVMRGDRSASTRTRSAI
ncbi:MAG: TIGR02757 family protein [Kiritimatiellae bacterium]|nr:TIGR02757 family protein [Kiritimatiellia bacterium]